MRPIWIISAIAVSLTTSAFAQGVDQNTRQQIEQLVTTYRENWNNHNAAVSRTGAFGEILCVVLRHAHRLLPRLDSAVR